MWRCRGWFPNVYLTGSDFVCVGGWGNEEQEDEAEIKVKIEDEVEEKV